mgnify:CR=1 FL=1
MRTALRQWWHDHSLSERRFMTVLAVLVALVFLWLGVWRPVTNSLAASWQRQGDALDRYAGVKAQVAALKALPAPPRGSAALPIDQRVGQSAAAAGFTLDQLSAQGAGRLSIHIDSARVGPLLGWLSRLEGQGVLVRTIGIVPGATEGTVSVQAVLEESRP